MLTQRYQIAAQEHATMTLTVLVKYATTISGVWAQIGPAAARSHHALKERGTVIIIWTVKAYYCVAMTTVQLDLQGWTAAQMMVMLTLYRGKIDNCSAIYRIYFSLPPC